MRAILLLTAASVLSAAPCDIFSENGTPCAAAHSTTRALYSSFNGKMYRLKRYGDNATIDITPLTTGGFADSAAHDAFCAANPSTPSPSPSPPNLPVPPLNSIVRLELLSLPGYAYRHCYSQGFVTPAADSGNDHTFKLVNALSGTLGAYSFQSTSYPNEFIAPTQDRTRPGIVVSPAALDASWNVTAAPGGGFFITSLSQGVGALSAGSTLSGTCAHSYASPSVDATLTSTTANVSAWAIMTEGPGPYPPLADCVILIIYDQSGNGNHMLPATPAINNPNFDNPVNASRHPITIGGGHKVYGAFFESGMGYRAQNTSLVAQGNDPETLYMITSGQHYNSGCCFDYGNSENAADNPSSFCDGCMEAIYFGTGGAPGWCNAASDGGPWLKADLENGLYACGTQGGTNPNNTALTSEYVTAMVKGGTQGFALKGGDATKGELKIMYDGPRPPGYQPMHKTGGIILGVGGDNVARGAVGIPGTSIGTFYEGVLTVGYSSDAADAAVQEDIINVGYGT